MGLILLTIRPMIKNFCNYILFIGDTYLLIILLAAILLIYGCSNYDEENAVDWDGFNYAKKCSGDSKNLECEKNDKSGFNPIGIGGKR